MRVDGDAEKEELEALSAVLFEGCECSVCFFIVLFVC
jgi:hypothetical protein